MWDKYHPASNLMLQDSPRGDITDTCILMLDRIKLKKEPINMNLFNLGATAVLLFFPAFFPTTKALNHLHVQ